MRSHLARISIAMPLLALMLLAAPASRAEEAVDPFKDLRPIVGKTWKSEGKDPEGKPMTDVSQWSWALGGKAIRIQHSVNAGEYAGETILFYDTTKKSLIFHYFTTAGFHTQGTMTTEPGKFISEEDVVGHPEIVKVLATGTVEADGTMKLSSEYVAKAGSRNPGHAFHYREAPDAKVVFKDVTAP